MQNAKCKMQNAKCKMQNAKCKMQNAKCKNEISCNLQTSIFAFYILHFALFLPYKLPNPSATTRQKHRLSLFRFPHNMVSLFRDQVPVEAAIERYIHS